MNPDRLRKEEEGVAPNIRPQFGSIQGGGETTPRETGHLSAVPSSGGGSKDGGGEGTGGLRALEGGGETSDPKRGHLRAVGAGGLADQEDAATKPLNYTGADKKGSGSVKGWITKKQAKVAGGISGGVLGIVLFLVTFLSGPMQIITLGNLLHFGGLATNEETGDARMSRFYRFMRKGGTIGDTRVSYLSSKYHERIVKQLAKIGVVPQYGPLTTYEGLIIDTKHIDSPYKNMTPEEAARAFKAETGITPEIKEGKLHVNAQQVWEQRKSMRAMLSKLKVKAVTTAVRARIMQKFGWVSRWNYVSRFDRKITVGLIRGTAKYSAKVSEAFKAWWKGVVKPGTTTGPIVAVNASEATTDKLDADNKPIPLTPEEQRIAAATGSDANASKSLLKSMKFQAGVGVVGGTAAAAGMTCILKAVDDKVATIRRTEIQAPLMRIGMNFMVLYQWIMSGVSVDPYDVQTLGRSLTSIDKETGKTVSVFDNAQIRAAAGQTGGIDSLKKNGTRDLLTQNHLPWLAWTHSPAVNGLCSTAGQIGTGVLSVGVGIVSGGILSTATGLIASSLLTGPMIDKVSELIAGDGISSELGGVAADVFGGELQEGVTLAASGVMVGMGGAAMTPKQVGELMEPIEEDRQQDFAAKGILARIFDTSDYQSLTSRVAMHTSSNALMNVNTVVSSVVGSFGSVLSMPFNLYSSTAHAADSTGSRYFDHGYPIYGFTKAEQENPLVEDPYVNAEIVAGILNKNNTDGTADWIQKAKECFGVNITKGSQGWDVIPETDVNVYDPDNYNPAACAGPRLNNQGKVISAVADTSKSAKVSIDPALTDVPIMAQTAVTPLTAAQAVDWFRIRFFILDTGVMEGYTCASFDDAQSCNNNYGTVQSAKYSPGTPGQVGPVDQATMYDDSTGIPCAPGTKDIGTENDAYHDGQKVPVRLCALLGVPSGSGESHDQYGVIGAEGNAIVNSRVSANFAALVAQAKIDKVSLSADSSFRSWAHQNELCDKRCQDGDNTYVASPGYSPHQMGLAIDFNVAYPVKADTTTCVGRARPPEPTATKDPMWDWLNKNAKKYGISQYTNESWHWDTRIRAMNCGGDGS